MVDRISTSWSYSQGIKDMMDLQSQVSTTYEQISSGSAILSASDDPVASARVLQLDQEINLIEQYEDNITLLESRLEIEDGILDGVENALQSIRELVVQAGNEAVYTDTDLASIAAEAQILLDEIVDLANSKDASGEYLFSGFQGDDQTFVEADGGGYTYQGDEGVRYLQISSTITIASSDSGKDIFLDIPSEVSSFYSSANDSNTGTGVISQGITTDQDELEAFYPEDFVIEFQNELDVDPPTSNYTVYRESDGRVMDGLENIEYSPGDTIEVGGMTVSITGEPDAGDQFFVESSSSQSMFVTIEKFIYALENYGNDSEFSDIYTETIANTLDNIDNAVDNVSEVRANIGARLSTTENTSDQHADNKLASQEIRSELEDLDYAEAVSALQYEEFVLEVTQQTYSSISQLSLFDFI